MGREHNGSNCSAENSAKEETQTEVLNFSVTNKILQKVQEIRSKGLHLERRVSPRLKNIPEEKRPYYGSYNRSSLCASKYDVCCRKTDNGDQKRRFDYLENNVLRDKAKVDIDARKTPAQHVSKISSEGLIFERRVSPRLKNIPADKRPFYGNVQRRQLNASIDGVRDRGTPDNYLKWQLDSPKDDVDKEKTKAEITVIKSNVLRSQKIKSDGYILKQRVSPRPHYGSERKRKLDATNEAYLEWKRCETFLADTMHSRSGVSERETEGGPKAFSPLMLTYTDSNDHNQSPSKHEAKNEILDVTLRTKVVQQFQKKRSTGRPLERRVSLRIKNLPIEKRPFYGGNQDGKLNAANDYVCNNSCRAGSLSVKYKNTETVDLENRPMGYKRFLACKMCQKAGVMASNKHHPYVVQERASKDFSNLPGYEVYNIITISHVHQNKSCELMEVFNVPSLVCEDISHGEEKIPIPATNFIDFPIAPTGFKYTNSIQVARNVVIPPSPSGCNCKGNCTNPKYCSCAQLNGSDFPCVYEDGGRLIEPKDVVFECGPGCGCGPNCINRISQRGLIYQLEVYRTLNKGWAVRSWDFIPSGAPVCEYIGVIRRTADLDSVSENDFIFEVDCWHTMKGIGGRERRQGDVSMHARYLMEKANEAESDTEFCVDGASSGNVTRFINHSCEPNLFVQCVLSSHHDIRLARIVLFAADDIPPMQELTYDYGYALDSVTGPDGKLKKMPCYCGTSECRGRLY